ncbi:UPF0686 protein C11orf1 homolog isoform X1 [Acropora millepora]|uniref:UPF0686 protein C11orf1 homolog isoform X1 n=1 Tax=Acropora millepora TaxID=45264 RepID=UPI001CF2D75C|nr:UPF0686 protein C11orf1 homolog isoform X1 [Acropora millepora]
MSYASQNVMPFVSELRATGHGELWDHTDEKKFQQFGWRCTNTESSYNTSTLIGNWNEQRFDINRISKPKPVPSQYNHYFETTYGSGYNTVDTSKVPEALKHLEGHLPFIIGRVISRIESEFMIYDAKAATAPQILPVVKCNLTLLTTTSFPKRSVG